MLLKSNLNSATKETTELIQYRSLALRDLVDLPTVYEAEKHFQEYKEMKKKFY